MILNHKITRMKKLIIPIAALLIYGLTANAAVMICETPQQLNCDKIAMVKIDNGPWVNACYDHFELNDIQTWEEERTIAGNNTDLSRSQALDYISNEILEGLRWTDKGTNTNHSLEFKENAIYKDGELFLTLKEDFSAIIMEVPNSGGMFVKIGVDEEMEIEKTDPNVHFDAFFKANEDELKAIEEIKAYPNPLHSGSPLQLLSPAMIDKTMIFDMNGKIVYQNENDWQGSSEVRLNNLKDGVYLVRFVTAKFGIKVSRKIIVTSEDRFKE